MSFLLKAWSHMPNIKGKLWLGNSLYKAFGAGEVDGKIQNFKMHLNLNDRIQRRIYLKKSHEPESEKVFKNLFKDANCFFDIGGNIGYFTLLACATNPDLKVHSFEPLPSNLNSLKTNLSLNPGFQERVTVVEKCLSDAAGEVNFYVPPEGECGWGTMGTVDETEGSEGNRDWPQITREALSLVDYLKQNPDTQPDLIKIDVEGAEYKVLQGALDYLKEKKVKAFCIELNEPTLKSCGTSSSEVIALMKGLGYQPNLVSPAGTLVPLEGELQGSKDFNVFFLNS